MTSEHPEGPRGDHLWMVRAGKGSRYIDEFREQDFVAIGFTELPRYSADIERDELKQMYAEAVPLASRGQVASQVGQVIRFLQELQIGEWMTTYDADRREYLLGEIESAPEWRETIEGLTWYRSVSWSHHVSRDALSRPTRNSLGAISTLFQLSGDPAREIFRGAVPLDTPLDEVTEPLPPEEPEEVEVLEMDILARAEELIEDQLVRLPWEQMQELVAGILRAMGYQTEVAGRGPDRGIDIFASPDGLGLEEPRIFVEVKHRRNTVIGGPEIRSFLGGRQPGDRCLYVSTGGFSKDAQYEAERANVPTKLIALPKLREWLVEYYEKLDPEIKTLVPLKRLYWPAE